MQRKPGKRKRRRIAIRSDEDYFRYQERLGEEYVIFRQQRRREILQSLHRRFLEDQLNLIREIRTEIDRMIFWSLFWEYFERVLELVTLILVITTIALMIVYFT